MRCLERFWGWSENAIEREKDFKELSQLAREGKPVWGHSDQPAYVLQSAVNNSRWSQLKFAAFPWYVHALGVASTQISSPLNTELVSSTVMIENIQVQPREPPSPWCRPCEVRTQGCREQWGVPDSFEITHLPLYHYFF